MDNLESFANGDRTSGKTHMFCVLVLKSITGVMSLLSEIYSADAQRQDMTSVYSVYSWDTVTTGVNITIS